jgi:hypothetical protein
MRVLLRNIFNLLEDTGILSCLHSVICEKVGRVSNFCFCGSSQDALGAIVYENLLKITEQDDFDHSGR